MVIVMAEAPLSRSIMRGQRGYKLPNPVEFANAPNVRLNNAEFTYPSVLSQKEQHAKELLNTGQINQKQYNNYMKQKKNNMQKKFAKQTQKKGRHISGIESFVNTNISALHQAQAQKRQRRQSINVSNSNNNVSEAEKKEYILQRGVTHDMITFARNKAIIEKHNDLLARFLHLSVEEQYDQIRNVLKAMDELYELFQSFNNVRIRRRSINKGAFNALIQEVIAGETLKNKYKQDLSRYISFMLRQMVHYVAYIHLIKQLESFQFAINTLNEHQQFIMSILTPLNTPQTKLIDKIGEHVNSTIASITSQNKK
jgi:hypothetical protein